MVIDTSAIIAIIFNEPERETFTRLLAAEPKLAVSVVTLHEAALVTAGKKRNRLAARLVDDFIRDMAIEVAPLDIESSLAARDAYFRFGRGWHPAGLNLADSFSYALANTREEPLLFKGDDFLKTDIVPAWRP
jgi:ribonuclease VapC